MCIYRVSYRIPRRGVAGGSRPLLSTTHSFSRCNELSLCNTHSPSVSHPTYKHTLSASHALFLRLTLHICAYIGCHIAYHHDAQWLVGVEKYIHSLSVSHPTYVFIYRVSYRIPRRGVAGGCRPLLSITHSLSRCNVHSLCNTHSLSVSHPTYYIHSLCNTRSLCVSHPTYMCIYRVSYRVSRGVQLSMTPFLSQLSHPTYMCIDRVSSCVTLLGVIGRRRLHAL